ncbi:MAG TPA: DUF1269 domain-containing protein [Solirubrobacteraceae bacterium]|jgi:uncharacterized membrane protein|nr:DUF1269 domain-containing protein [Solirubrobacteraceae bacterium]
MSDEPVFVYVAAYDEEDDARADYEVLKELHAAGVVGTYDAALITKDDEGKVHVHKREKPTQHGAWTGVGVGALLGILFPPSILGSAVVAGAAGGLMGHLWHGMSRGDMKDLGEALDDGDAALIIVGRSKLEETLDRELKRANRRIEKQIKADSKELDKELSVLP